jgi:uncharacterized membrane protein YdfJ with MMPL/SSD domain
LWLLIGGIIIATAPPLADVTSSNQEDFLPTDAESYQAVQLVRERYPTTGGVPAVIVFHHPSNLDPTALQIIDKANLSLSDDVRPDNIETVLARDGSPQLDATLLAPDGRTVTTIVTISGSPASPEFAKAVDWIRETAQTAADDTDLVVAVTGPAGITADAIRVFDKIDFRVTLFTVLLVLVLLLVIYRSPALALLPLVGVGWTLLIAQGLAATLSDNANLVLTGQTTALMSVLLFGAGTDFTLFIVSRYREELRSANTRWDAMQYSLASIGPAITSSAGTTIAAMLALLLASLGSFKALGPVLSISIALMLLSGLTLIPAITVLLGQVAFWPRRIANEGQASRAWTQIANWVVRRPVAILLTTLCVLVVLAAGVPTIKPSANFLEGFPDDVESKIGALILDESFGAGELAPTNVFIQSSGGDIYKDLVAAEAISVAIAELPGIAKVSGPTRPDGQAPNISAQRLQDAMAVLPEILRKPSGPPPSAMDEQPLSDHQAEIMDTFLAGRRFISADGTVLRLDVVMIDDPYSSEALDRITLIRQMAVKAAKNAGVDPSLVLVGGSTALQADTRDAVDRDVRLIGPIVVALIWLILLLLLRSIVAATYLVGSVMLSFLSALGISVVIFQVLMGHTGVGYQNAVWMFIFLAALGADYNILIMSRLKEETRRRGLIEGTRQAISRTGGVITSAGIILAGTFSILCTLPLRDIFQLGFAVALGILLDTFVVRALLVPSIVLVLKRWNWWPSTIDKLASDG